MLLPEAVIGALRQAGPGLLMSRSIGSGIAPPQRATRVFFLLMAGFWARHTIRSALGDYEVPTS